MSKAKEETTAIATYGEWSPEQMEKEAKEMASGGDYWKVPVGSTAVRFLPPKLIWKRPSPFIVRHQHYIEMPNLDKAVIFCCPKMHTGARCLSCGKADEMEASGNSRDEKAAKKLRPSKQMLANVINTPKVAESKPVIWTFGVTVYNQLKSIREDDEGGGNFVDPIKGFNIIVKRVGASKDDTRYTCIPARDIKPLLNMDWIEIQSDLSRQIRIPTVEQQKRLFDGEDPRDVWGDAKVDRAHGSQRAKDDSNAIDADATDAPGRSAEDDIFDDDIDVD